LPPTRSELRGALNGRVDAENKTIKHVRVTAEWPYERATNLFHILHSRYHKILLENNRNPYVIITQQLHVLFFLYNYYVYLNGSKFSRYFYVIPPTLE
jgi:hypothetical protein